MKKEEFKERHPKLDNIIQCGKKITKKYVGSLCLFGMCMSSCLLGFELGRKHEKKASEIRVKKFDNKYNTFFLAAPKDNQAVAEYIEHLDIETSDFCKKVDDANIPMEDVDTRVLMHN